MTQEVQGKVSSPHFELTGVPRILAAATVAGFMAVPATGCGIAVPGMSHGPVDESIQNNLLGVPANKKVHGHSKSPDARFNATSLAILDDGILIGSAGIVKDSANVYKVATVEHVARSLYGMPAIVKPGNTGSPHIVVSPHKSTSPEYNVPGIGIMVFDAGDPTFEGSDKVTDTRHVIDRYATLPLSPAQQHAIKEAEAKGILSVPKTAPLAPKFGDVLNMPLADSGKNVPFVYYGTDSSRQGTGDLVPLYVLDHGLDYAQGIKTFQDRISKIQKENADKRFITSSQEAAYAAVQQLQSEFLMSMLPAGPNTSEEALHLACMGDSGSPFLDKDGNVVGVLSTGEPFYRATGKSDASDGTDITREGYNKDASRYCLGSVTIAPTVG